VSNVLGNRIPGVVLLVCAVVATLSLVFMAVQQRTEARCARASANADAWVAVNVVARDFNRPVSLAENRAAVKAIDRRLKACLPGGR
jgi:hypothetical protein